MVVQAPPTECTWSKFRLNKEWKNMTCNKCDHKFKKYSYPRCTNSMYMKRILVIERKNIHCNECGYKFIRHGVIIPRTEWTWSRFRSNKEWKNYNL